MSHKRLSFFAAGALLLGVALGALPGVTAAYAADARGNGKNQGKAGDECTKDTDCEKSPAPLRCVASGEANKKVCGAPAPRIPPPT